MYSLLYELGLRKLMCLRDMEAPNIVTIRYHKGPLCQSLSGLTHILIVAHMQRCPSVHLSFFVFISLSIHLSIYLSIISVLSLVVNSAPLVSEAITNNYRGSP